MKCQVAASMGPNQGCGNFREVFRSGTAETMLVKSLQPCSNSAITVCDTWGLGFTAAMLASRSGKRPAPRLAMTSAMSRFTIRKWSTTMSSDQ